MAYIAGSQFHVPGEDDDEGDEFEKQFWSSA
jgi:hypothetical protein